MAHGAPALGLVIDLVRRMARSDEVYGRVDSMLDLVSDLVGAKVGVVVQADPTHTVVHVIGGGVPGPGGGGLSRDLELMRASDLLLDPVGLGDLTPRSAEREFGAEAWASSSQRAGCLRHFGVDQVCTLPLSGGPDFLIAMFGRVGDDFGDADLEQLEQIREVVADVVALAGLRPLPTPDARPRLTEREADVLRLLSHGHTCARIGRQLGASPRTVEVHLGRIYDKLGVHDRLSAVLAAYDLGLIPPRSASP